MGCRQRTSPDELVRVVRAPDGSLQVSRTLPGRGAWLHAGSLSCAGQAARKGALARALRTDVSRQAVSSLLDRLEAGS